MNGDQYRRTRRLYYGESTVEYLFALLVEGAFLAKLTAYLGFSDGLTAILTSFLALGTTFQSLSMLFFRGTGVKRKLIFFCLLNEMLFTALFFLPSVTMPSGVKTGIFVVCFFLAHLFLNVTYSPKADWYMTTVDAKKRGVFSARKEMISLICGTVFSLVMGNVMDRMEALGNLRGGFLIGAATLLVLMAVHISILVFSQEIPKPAPEGKSLGQRLGLLKNAKVRSAMVVAVVWSMAVRFATPFYGTYAIKELGLTLTEVSWISGVAYSAFRIAFSFLWGRIADRYSFARMVMGCFMVAGTAFAVQTFTVPANGRVFYTLYYILYAISMGGINSAMMNLMLDYAPEANRSDALAIKGTFSGITGFLATIMVTPLVNRIQQAGNSFLGLPVYAQQVVSALAATTIFTLAVYVYFRMVKEKK